MVALVWTCTRCGREFANRNQWHSCGTFRAEDHLEGATPAVANLYRRFERIVRSCGPVSLTPTKEHIAFRGLVQFAGVKVQKDGLRIGLVFGRRLESPRFVKISTFSPGSHLHSLFIRSPSDLDDELVGWVQEACRAGQLRQRSGSRDGEPYSLSQNGS